MSSFLSTITQNFVCTSKLQVRFYAKRAYKKSKNAQLIRAPARKTLEQPRQVFLFGNFSGLHLPQIKTIETSRKAIESISSFASLRIFPTVRAAMVQDIKRGYNFKNTYMASKDDLEIKPSPVQVAAIRKINQPRNTKSTKSRTLQLGAEIFSELMAQNDAKRLKVFTIAAETGSGKTWAYTAPMLTKLKEEDMELFNISDAAYAEAKASPIIRALVLLPTHELVDQVYDTLKSANDQKFATDEVVDPKLMSDAKYARFLRAPDQLNGLHLNIRKFGAGDSHRVLFDGIKQRVDVLVTTPGKIQGLAKLQNVDRPFRFFNHVQYCVVDEADTLMDNSWVDDTTAVLRRLTKCKDLVFCSATIPKQFNRTLSKMFPDEKSIIHINTPALHKIPRQIVVKIIDAQVSPYNGSKTRCLAQALYAIHNDGTEPGYVKRILVFVNEKKDVAPLVDVLVKKYGNRPEDIIGITGDTKPEERKDLLEPFLKPAELVEDDIDQSKIKVLVTTDLMARGMNFVGIKNVILMDLPNTSVDLMHRVGRTGRMRQSGRVFVIIDKKTGKSWIKGLPNVVKRGITVG